MFCYILLYEQVKDTHEKERYLLYREREKLTSELNALRNANDATGCTSTTIATALHARLEAEVRAIYYCTSIVLYCFLVPIK
jgi:hypothetical protein